jgi:hypothetical protein
MMKLSNLFPVLLSILMFSCQKDDTNNTTTPTDPVVKPAKLKKVYAWLDNKDTLTAPDDIDTIYYNSKDQIEKVVSARTAYSSGIAIYQISYNTNGSISKIQSSGTDNFYHADYTFIYNSSAQLDTLKTSWYYFGTNIFSTFKYDANGDLSDVYLYGHRYPTNALYVDSHTSYYRNASRKIDSINTLMDPEFPNFNRSFKYTPTNTVNTIDKTYLLTVQLRFDPQFNFGTLNSGVLYLHQFMNPNDNLFSSGTEDGHDMPQPPYNSTSNYVSPFYHTYLLYPNKQIHTLIPYYHLYPNTTPQPQTTMRFEYL